VKKSIILSLVITLTAGMLFLAQDKAQAQTATYSQRFESNDFLKVHLLFTNDLHGGIAPSKAWFMNPEFPPDLGGGASMYTYVNEVRQQAAAEGAAVVLVDGGNIYQGSSIGMADSGRTMIDWMNELQYDAAAIGVQEFMFGIDNIAALDQRADFPLLSANLTTPNYDPQDDLILTYQGVKLGIIGLTTANAPYKLLPGQTWGVTFQPEIPTLKHQLAALQSRDVNCVIGLFHLGVPYQRENEFAEFIDTYEDEGNVGSRIITNLELAHLVPGVDIIVSGGTNAGYNTPWEDPLTHTLVVQGYGGASNIGHIILYIDKQTGTLAGYKQPFSRGVLFTLSTDDVQPDQPMARQLSFLQKTLNAPHGHKFPVTVPAELPSATPKHLDRWQLDVPDFDQQHSLEVVTWNMEHFPKANDSTVTAVAEIMTKVNADLYAVQEIQSLQQFAALAALLPAYDFQVTRQSAYLDQGIIYKKSVLTLVGREEPFADDDYNFAGRGPLRVDFMWHQDGQLVPVSVFDIHLKCCGNGLERRKKSMVQFHDYLSLGMELGEDNIIVLGDWNDQLDDVGPLQSFGPFLDDPQQFQFATARIAGDVEQASYPDWPSFLDQILIGKGLFDEFANHSEIQTLPVQKWLGTFDNYKQIISDHRPVLLQLNMGQ